MVAATSGPVADDALALPEVSRRSPLAPWKLLTRAIASFYRRDDESCRRYIEAIDQESAPARLVPAIKTMLASHATTPLTPAAEALGARITRESTLRSALEALDQAFASANKSRILKAVRPAVDQCQQISPDQLDSLRQHISVRCGMADFDTAKVAAAMRGPSRHDATFLRLFARGLETRDPEHAVMACRIWEDFRRAAEQEGWFADNGQEAAVLALHIADLLKQLPEDLLRELQWSARNRRRRVARSCPTCFPTRCIGARACSTRIPRHFPQWMEWAARQPGRQVEPVAEAWHKIRPRDIEPVLRLMKVAETRRAFSSALGYLAKAEQIDGLHPQVRADRLRLFAAVALRHLQQKKPALAAADLANLSALPEAQQGDRPAFVAALKVVMSGVRGDSEQAAASRRDVERLLGSGAAAALLVLAVASASRQRAIGQQGIDERPGGERGSLPGAVARVAALATDMHLKLEIPASWMVEVAKQFPASRQTLDAAQLRTLGDSAVRAGHGVLAYKISTAGLERDGASEAGFLLLRARSVTEQYRAPRDLRKSRGRAGQSPTGRGARRGSGEPLAASSNSIT